MRREIKAVRNVAVPQGARPALLPCHGVLAPCQHGNTATVPYVTRIAFAFNSVETNSFSFCNPPSSRNYSYQMPLTQFISAIHTDIQSIWILLAGFHVAEIIQSYPFSAYIAVFPLHAIF